MKKCLNCGFDNQDANLACVNCGKAFVSPMPIQPQPYQQVPIPHPSPVMSCPQPIPIIQRKAELSFFDVLSILGFVASICGTFWCSIILLPLALIASILGFIKGTRFRGLAVAGIVISTIGAIIQIVAVLYKNDLIPKWVYSGFLG